MKGYKQVTKEEFEDFRDNYGSKLVADVAGMCEPPLLTLNDFSDGKKWPESIVAKAYIMDGSDYYDGKTTEYFLKEV